MRERLHSVHDQVRENGVTYNVYADPQGAGPALGARSPAMILPEEEWGRIEAGIVQRATLLNKVLLDVYGEQRSSTKACCRRRWCSVMRAICARAAAPSTPAT